MYARRHERRNRKFFVLGRIVFYEVKEAFSFGPARKLLAYYEGTPLHLDPPSPAATAWQACGRYWTADRRETGCPQGSNGAKRSGNSAESLAGDITIEPDSPSFFKYLP